MSKILLRTDNISVPSAKSFTESQWDALLDAQRLPFIAAEDFEVLPFIGLHFGVEYQSAGDNIIKINDDAFDYEIKSGSLGYDEESFSFSSSGTGEIKSKKLYANDSELILTRKGTEAHIVHFYAKGSLTPLFSFDTDSGVLSDANAGTLDTATFSGGYAGGDDIELKFQIVGEGQAIIIYEDDVEIASYTLEWQYTFNNPDTELDSWQSGFGIGEADIVAMTPAGDAELKIALRDTVAADDTFFFETVYDVVIGTALAKSTNEKTFSKAQGESVTQAIAEFTGGVGDIVYSVSGNMPSGWNVVGTNITGTTTQSGEFNFSITAKDEYGQQQIVNYIATVLGKTNFSYNPPDGAKGKSYYFKPTKPVGLTAYAIAGSIPNGWSFNTATGVLSGTATEFGDYNFTVSGTFSGGASEEIDVDVSVYDEIAIEYDDGESQTALVNNLSSDYKVGDTGRFVVTGGSGNFSFSVNNGNLVSSDGDIQLLRAGDSIVTVTDTSTGATFFVLLKVKGQDSVVSIGGIDDEVEEIFIGNPDLITQCGSSISVLFDGWSLISNYPNEAKSFPAFDNIVNGKTFESDKPFAKFVSTADNALVSVKRTAGVNFLTNFVITPSMIALGGNVGMGVGQDENLDTPLRYEVTFTDFDGARILELRKDGDLIPNSRIIDITEGMTVAFAVIDGSVYLWLNDDLEQTVTMTDSCANHPLVVYAQDSGVTIGGKVENLTYEIGTSGTPDEVGIVNSQTGEYNPSVNNTPRIQILGVSDVNSEVTYRSYVRVVKPSPMVSLEQATLEFADVRLWLADMERLDDLPLRLPDGRPDANQIKNAIFLGRLQGAVSFSATEDKQDASDDAKIITTSHRITKYSITGGYLQIRDFNKNKELIPYTQLIIKDGVRILRQFASGCQKKKRLIAVWENPSCGDIKIYDALEFHKVISYTLMNFEAGLSTQSQVPLSLDAFGRAEDDAIWDFQQFDENYVRIGR